MRARHLLALAAIAASTLSTAVLGQAWSRDIYGSDTTRAAYPGSNLPGVEANRAMAMYAVDRSVTVAGAGSNGSNLDWKVVRIGENGTIHWTQTFNGGQDDGAMAVVHDAQGDAYVTGFQRLGATSDLRVVKYARHDGAVLWTQQFNGAGNSWDHGAAIALDPAGNVFVTGYASRAGTGEDWPLLKIDGATGVVLWDVYIAGSGGGQDRGRRLLVDASGNAYVGGTVVNASGFADKKVVKFSGANGSVLWQWSEATAATRSEELTALVLGADGNLFAGGSRDNGATVDAYWAKLDGATGARLWQGAHGGTGDTSARAIALEGADPVIVMAKLNGTNPDIYARRVNGATGSPMWSTTYDNAGLADFPHDAVAAGGLVMIVGETGNDAITLTLDATTGVPFTDFPGGGSANAPDAYFQVLYDASDNRVRTLGRFRETGFPDGIRVERYAFNGEMAQTVSLAGPSGTVPATSITLTPTVTGGLDTVEGFFTWRRNGVVILDTAAIPGSNARTFPVDVGPNRFTVEYRDEGPPFNEPPTISNDVFVIGVPAASLQVTRTDVNSVATSATITSSTPGIACPPTCSHEYLDSALPVTLTANFNAALVVFQGWSGPCDSTTATTCTIATPGTKAITGTFLRKALTTPTTAIDFGTQVIGTAPVTRSIVLTAYPAGPVTVSAGLIGLGTGVTFGTICGQIPAGTTCTMTLTFDPTTPGAKSGTLVLSSGVEGMPQFEIPFTGFAGGEPDTVIQSGPEGFYPAGPFPDFTFASTTPGSTFECSFNGAAFTACTSPKSTSVNPITNMTHTFRVRAVVDGITDPTPAERLFAKAMFPTNSANMFPPSIDFGSHASGQPIAVDTLIFSNGGNTYIDILEMAFSTAGRFEIVGGSCAVGVRVQIAGNCTIDVRPVPGLEVGFHAADVIVSASFQTFGVVPIPASLSVTITGTTPVVRKPRDANGDARSDVFWSDPNGQAALWLMDGTAPIDSALLLGPSTGWTMESVLGDFNGDGRADIAWKHASGMWAVWLMNGVSPSDYAVILGPSTGWSVTHVGDFDGDGNSDLLWQHTDGSVSMWLMDGLGIASSTILFGPGTPWSVTHVADLDGDGRSDLVWRNASDASVSAWLMNGLNVTDSGFVFGGGTTWQVIHTGDFGGDGRMDLVFRDAGGQLSVFLMNGLAVANSGIVYNGGAFEATHVADFSGDGKADLLFKDAAGQVAVWLFDGLGVTGSAILFGGGGGWMVTHTGDYDGDGKADLLWKDSGGQVAIWTLDGTTVTGSALIFGGNGGWVAGP